MQGRGLVFSAYDPSWTFWHFSPLTGGCPEGLDAVRFFFYISRRATLNNCSFPSRTRLNSHDRMATMRTAHIKTARFLYCGTTSFGLLWCHSVRWWWRSRIRKKLVLGILHANITNTCTNNILVVFLFMFLLFLGSFQVSLFRSIFVPFLPFSLCMENTVRRTFPSFRWCFFSTLWARAGIFTSAYLWKWSWSYCSTISKSWSIRSDLIKRSFS